ncbi:hypothetical protein Goshw_001061 [Gossypium schwendimanii]|uniref:Zinc knuckle CX2CX4HX4C domain-containing protein n=1 Tax=Gossypium schwendimanii TaxID=34291 RepID=A0A7J9LZJ5_GOSSC|nr:hypothetical protein [Gossypium schwendimanii]
MLKSLWHTKEPVNFVAMADGLFLVKFGLREDRERILNMAHWSFDQCLFSMVPFVKGQDISRYCFLFVPFWVRIFNIPLEKMERQVAIDNGSAIGEVLAIDRRDREGCWVEYIRVRVKLDIFKPLRRVHYMVGAEGEEILCTINYERLPTFCYLCGCIGHHTHKCGMYERIKGVENLEFQYGNWLRAQMGQLN